MSRFLSRSGSSPIFSSESRRSAAGRMRSRLRHRFAPGMVALEARALLSTLWVTNDTDDPAPGSGSLRGELASAGPGDTIRFKPAAYGTITLADGPLPVATSVDIQGPGADKVTVSGGGRSDVFEVHNGVTATISGLTVTDGVLHGPYVLAGGIYNAGTLTLSDVVVTGNAVAPGSYGTGGIASSGPLTIDHSTVSGNTGNDGGGVLVRNNSFFGGPDATLTVTDSSISGNTVPSGSLVYGAGILAATGVDVAITGSSVDDNSGGGITIYGSSFGSLSTLAVTDSSVSGNTITQAPGSFVGAYGAGISANGTDVTIIGSTIDDNVLSGTSPSGGGIYMAPSYFGTGPALTVADSTFRGNQVAGTPPYGSGQGGAIDVEYGNSLSVTGSTFQDNSVTASLTAQGGAINLAEIASGTIADSTFQGNRVMGSGNASIPGAIGGAIASLYATSGGGLTISGSAFLQNQARGVAGGGYAQGGAISNAGYGSTLNVSSSQFVGNSAVGGAAASAGGSVGGPGQGGALYNLNAIANISDSSFLGNVADGGGASSAGTQAGDGQGGAIANEFDGRLAVSGSTLVGNQADGGNGYGGAVGGDGQGGAIHHLGDSLQVGDSTILGNRAVGGSGGGAGEGGGVAVSAGSAAFTDVLISLNAAIGGSGGGNGYGGGLYIGTGAITTLKKARVVLNAASTAGDNIDRA